MTKVRGAIKIRHGWHGLIRIEAVLTACTIAYLVYNNLEEPHIGIALAAGGVFGIVFYYTLISNSFVFWCFNIAVSVGFALFVRLIAAAATDDVAWQWIITGASGFGLLILNKLSVEDAGLMDG